MSPSLDQLRELPADPDRLRAWLLSLLGNPTQLRDRRALNQAQNATR
jgi:hypothetical protein